MKARQPVMPVIGFLHSASADGSADRVRAFREGLKEVGFVEGENVGVEYRWTDQCSIGFPRYFRCVTLPKLAG